MVTLENTLGYESEGNRIVGTFKCKTGDEPEIVRVSVQCPGASITAEAPAIPFNLVHVKASGPVIVVAAVDDRSWWVGKANVCDMDNDGDVDTGDLGLLLAETEVGADVGAKLGDVLAGFSADSDDVLNSMAFTWAGGGTISQNIQFLGWITEPTVNADLVWRIRMLVSPHTTLTIKPVANGAKLG